MNMQAGRLERLHHQMQPAPPEMPCREGRMFTLGRTENRQRTETEIILCPSEFVSRQHCDIYFKNQAFWIKDLKSLNGTFLNGMKIIPYAERELRFGDVVGLGVSHDALDVNVQDIGYYVFTFKAQQFEVIELDSEDERVSNDVQSPNSSPQPQCRQDMISDAEIEILEERLPSTPASPTKSTSRSLPPPPPPPIISRPPESGSRNERHHSVENLASSSSSATGSIDVGHSTVLHNHGIGVEQARSSKTVGQTVVPSHKLLKSNGPSESRHEQKTRTPSKSSPPLTLNKKAGPASFKKKLEERRKNQVSTAAPAKEFPLESRSHPSSSEKKSSPKLSPIHRISTETSGDDSSDGMSESFSHQRFTPNIELSPENSCQRSKSKRSDRDEDTLNKKSDKKLKVESRHSSKDNQPSTSKNSRNGVGESTKLKSKKDGDSKSSRANILKEIRKRDLRVYMKRIIIRNKRTGELNMRRSKFEHLSSSNQMKIALQFNKSYDRNNPPVVKTAKDKSKGEESDFDSAEEISLPVKRKKPRISESNSSEDMQFPQKSRRRQPTKKPERIRPQSSDSSSSDTEYYEPKSKKSKTTRTSSVEKENRVKSRSNSRNNSPLRKDVAPKPHCSKDVTKDHSKDDAQKPQCSKDLVKEYSNVDDNCRALSPVSDDGSIYSDIHGVDDIETYIMDPEEDTNEGDSRTLNELSPPPDPKKTVARQIQFIDHAPPPPNVARKMDLAKRKAQLDFESRNSKISTSKPLDHKDIKKKRAQELKEVASRNEKAAQDVIKPPSEIKRPPAPAGAKITPRNRNQDLIDSMMQMAGSEQIQKELDRATTNRAEPEPVQEPEISIPAPRREIPPIPSPKTQAAMPLQMIRKDMERFRSTEEEARKRMPPPKVQPPPAAIVRDPRRLAKQANNSTSNDETIIMDYDHRSAVPVAQINSSSVYPDDEAYKRILKWRPVWLEEQKKHTSPPPIVDDLQLVRTLYDYKDYKSYVEIFFPLILFEIWATLTQDYSNKKKSRDNISEHNTSELSFKIDVMTKCQMCPMLKKSKVVVKQKEEGMFWTKVQCHGLIARKSEIAIKRDLAILTVKVHDKDDDGKPTMRERDYFAYVLNSTEMDVPLTESSCIVDPRLRQQYPEAKFKHCVTVVIHTSAGENIIETEFAKMKRVSYLSPKLRDVKAMNYLKYSRLMSHIINPKLPLVLYDPAGVPSQHQMIQYVSKLNKTQQAVVSYISNRVLSDAPELLLLHGPPGTGKTRTIVGMILQLLLPSSRQIHRKSRDSRILVCTPSNTALDEIMIRLEGATKDLPRDSKVSMVRVGETHGSRAQKYSLDTLARRLQEKSSTRASIREGITQCEKEIRDKKAEITDLTKAPSHSKTTLESLRRELKDIENRRDDYESDLRKQRLETTGFTIFKKKVMEGANIVFSTLNSCSNSFLSNMFGPSSNRKCNPFLCCIVDEASQTTEPETLAPLLLQVDKLILVGDPHQLGATVLSSEAEQKYFGLSLFARLHHYYTKTLKNPHAVMMLTQQYRMHPEILQWPNEYFYKGQLKSQCIGRSEKDVCIVKPYLFFNLSSKESSNHQGQISNNAEVQMVVNIIRNISLMIKTEKLKPWSIGVITPYSTQKKAITDSIKKDLVTMEKHVEVDTVDSFQGREMDIVIISCVRTDDTGFLKNPLRLNVALTRAKYSLLMIGDASCLQRDPMWKSLIDNAKERMCFMEVNSVEKDNPGFFNKKLYNLLSPSKSQIPDEQRKRDWLGT